MLCARLLLKHCWCLGEHEYIRDALRPAHRARFNERGHNDLSIHSLKNIRLLFNSLI